MPRDDAGSRSPTSRRGQKRANGEGTIYQRKDDPWEGAAFVLTTTGTHRRVRVYGSTRDDARKKLMKLIPQSDQGILVASAAWSVAEYLNYWLRDVVLQERRPKTYQGYEDVVRLHLIPGIGSKRLAKLTVQDVRIFLTRTRQECQCCENGWDAKRSEPRCCARGHCCESRLSPRMVQSIHAVLRNALESAVREEIIPRNAAKLVQIPAPQVQSQSRPDCTAGQGCLRGCCPVPAGCPLCAGALPRPASRRAARASLGGCRPGRGNARSRPDPPTGRRGIALCPA